jgi:hypothetical protein
MAITGSGYFPPIVGKGFENSLPPNNDVSVRADSFKYYTYYGENMLFSFFIEFSICMKGFVYGVHVRVFKNNLTPLMSSQYC